MTRNLMSQPNEFDRILRRQDKKYDNFKTKKSYLKSDAVKEDKKTRRSRIHK